MTDLIKHNSSSPPQLAPAALIEHEAWYDKDRPWFGGITVSRVDAFGGQLWYPGLVYRPLTDNEGHKLISAEGLPKGVRWVVTDEFGAAYGCLHKPTSYREGGCPVGQHIFIPPEFAHPGDYRDSCYRVEGR